MTYPHVIVRNLTIDKRLATIAIIGLAVATILSATLASLYEAGTLTATATIATAAAIALVATATRRIIRKR